MSDDIDAQISAKADEAASSRTLLDQRADDAEKSIAAWIAGVGANLAKSTVVTKKPEKAAKLGAEAVRVVRAAVDELQESALTRVQSAIPRDSWPHNRLTDESFSSTRWSGTAPAPGAFYGKLPAPWEDSLRRVLGATVGQALVSTGFDAARLGSRGDGEWDGSSGSLRYPFMLNVDTLKPMLDTYDEALRVHVHAETGRRELIKKKAQNAAAELWDDSE